MKNKKYFVQMKFLQTILFLIVIGLLVSRVAGAQNVSIWQEPYDSNENYPSKPSVENHTTKPYNIKQD